MLSLSLSLRTTTSTREDVGAKGLRSVIKKRSSRFLSKSSRIDSKENEREREKQNHHQIEDEFLHKIERRIDV